MFHVQLFFLAAGTNLGTMRPEAASYSGRSRACVESVLVFQIMKAMEEKLASEELYVPFVEVCAHITIFFENFNYLDSLQIIFYGYVYWNIEKIESLGNLQ